MADTEDEAPGCFVCFGTPIEREEDTSVRKRKAIADAGQLRALPAWKQEVRDEEGRRRFHGAFTGGFSAGYYNTVGSKEGWTPQTFTSSRKNRAETKQQSIYSFLDEDDMKDIANRALETSGQYDTFGFTAAEVARKNAEKEQERRPSAIPGPAPDEVVLPAMHSIGVKLLSGMGWRQGRSIKDVHRSSLNDVRREGRKAFIALSSIEEEELDKAGLESEGPLGNSMEDVQASGTTPIYVLQPKQDLYGLGYDPFKNAPEFRGRKGQQISKRMDQGRDKGMTMRSLLSSNSGKYAPGFGIGALEELDVEDEDIYASGFSYEKMEVDDDSLRLTSDDKLKLEDSKRGFLSFKTASISDYKLERFPPPVVPANFEPYHKFTAPAKALSEFSGSAPPVVPPPDDSNLRFLIEGSAVLVARCGKPIEDFYKEKSKTNQLFLFLCGGEGSDYYARKLWEHKQKYGTQQKPDDVNAKSNAEKLNAENRGKLLGERPLARSHSLSMPSGSMQEVMQPRTNSGVPSNRAFSLVDIPESEKPFKDDPAKQARFEQFLKEKYLGGLRSAHSANVMSEADRARERLDFEAAAEDIERRNLTKGSVSSSKPLVEMLPGVGEQRFVASTHIEMEVKEVEEVVCLKREYFEWRPYPILCKRFDIVDPFMGKPMPVQKPRSRIDEVIFTAESARTSKNEEKAEASRDAEVESGAQDKNTAGILSGVEVEPSTSAVQRPVDLYKAIFSDDSDDDTVETATPQPVDPVKTSEGANMALNRLVAGDFLESIGKELGLEIPPPGIPGPPRKEGTSSISGTDSKVDSCVATRRETSVAAQETTNMPTYTIEAAAGDRTTEPKAGKAEIMEFQSAQARAGSRSPDSGASGDKSRNRKRSSHLRRDRGRNRAADTDSSSDAYESSIRRHRRKHGRSRSPDSERSGGHRRRERSGSDRKSRRDDSEHSHRHKHRKSTFSSSRRKDPA